MDAFQESNVPETAGTPRWIGLAVAALAGVSLLSLGVGWTARNHAQSMEATQAALKQSNEAVGQRLARAEEENRMLHSDLQVVTSKLNVTKTELNAARKQTKAATVDYDKKITGLETTVKGELATKASLEEVSRLNGDVTGVKNDLDATKSNLQMARSEMGTLIARNHEEIDQLRRMGQRDYFEFTVKRKGGAQRVGAVKIELKETNTKKNQFTIIVLADDKSFEKKNRSVNEPIFFYSGGSQAALELVINKMTKTQASGYLSVPKTASPAAATASSGQ